MADICQEAGARHENQTQPNQIPRPRPVRGRGGSGCCCCRDGRREAGAGEEAGAGSEELSVPAEVNAVEGDASDPAQPLTLTLTGPSTSTTTRGQGYASYESIYDDEGNFLRTEQNFSGHFGIKMFTVSWSVSGGSAPYTLTMAARRRIGPGRSAVRAVRAWCSVRTPRSRPSSTNTVSEVFAPIR